MKLIFGKIPVSKELLVPGVSLLVLIFSWLAFNWYQNPPPSVAGVIFTQREGAIEYQAPRQVGVASQFEVSFSADTQNQRVNAVGLYLSFNPNHLRVEDIETTDSFCQFYPEKKFDNDLGRVSLACGSPHPGFAGEGEIIKVTFTAKVVTNTHILVDPRSRILLSDGSGTNILTSYPKVPITILSSI